MADGINLPSNLYTAGAVPLDISPATNVTLGLMAKQQARSEALDNYFRDLTRTTTPDGVRPQDVSGYMKKFNDWQNFHNQNKANIFKPQNDNGASQTEDNQRYQDLMAYTNQSKQEAAKSQKLLEMKIDPKTAYQLNHPDIINSIEAHELPLDNSGHKSINLDQLQLNSQPLQAKDLLSINGNIMKGIVPSPTGPATKDGNGNIFTPMGFTDNDKKTALQRAYSVYASSPQYVAHAERIMTDPQMFSSANQAFIKVAGHPIQNEADAFAAEQLSMAGLDREMKPMKSVDTYGVANLKSKNSLINQERLIPLRLGAQETLKKYGVDYVKSTQQEQTEANEGIVNDDFQRAKDPTKGGKSVVGPDGQLEYQSPGNAVLQDLPVFKAGKGKDFSKADAVRYNNDGTQMRGVWYMKDPQTHKPIPDGQGGYREDPSGVGGWVNTESVKPLVGKYLGKLAQRPPAGQQQSSSGQHSKTTLLTKGGFN